MTGSRLLSAAPASQAKPSLSVRRQHGHGRIPNRRTLPVLPYGPKVSLVKT
jgi:hypothetical protein